MSQSACRVHVRCPSVGVRHVFITCCVRPHGAAHGVVGNCDSRVSRFVQFRVQFSVILRSDNTVTRKGISGESVPNSY